MRTKMLENGLTPEVNTVEDFVSEGKALEAAMKTMEHYDRYSTQTTHRTGTTNTLSRHEAKAKKVGITFMKKADLNNHDRGAKPRVFVNHRNTSQDDNNTGLRPRQHDHHNAKEKQEHLTAKPRNVYYTKPQVPDKNTSGAEPTVICFNCDEPGHYARDCKKPKRDKSHIRAAHTAIMEEMDETGNGHGKNNEPTPSERSSHRSNGSRGSRDDEDELVEVDVYDNDWYERESDSENMFAIREGDRISTVKPHLDEPTQNNEDKARFRKVQLRADKTARPRPEIAREEKECLVTFIRIGECEAWTLWDSGSTTTGITPAFAQVADIRVFPLTIPHMLQLGTIGSRATVNYGAEVEMKAPGISQSTYVDIANFDRYDMIIGTPFMHQNKVILDFENKQVIINGVATPATKVLLEDNDGRIRRYRSVDKRKN
jgi:hypothetical protein